MPLPRSDETLDFAVAFVADICGGDFFRRRSVFVCFGLSSRGIANALAVWRRTGFTGDGVFVYRFSGCGRDGAFDLFLWSVLLFRLLPVWHFAGFDRICFSV